MLKQLLIKNIAIIESLDLSFHEGLTVITGESGSGKSILLDSISLAFGAKASPREILRAGCERGQVELLFDIGSLQDHVAFREFLANQGVALLADETEILLSREFTQGGSRSRINGIPVTREVLESVRPWVIDLHGQHELTSLFQRDKQRLYLDAFGGSAIAALKRDVSEAYDQWSGLRNQWEKLNRNRQDLERQRDFLVFQLNELTEARLATENEDVQARQELEILGHAEKLIRVATEGSAMLSEGDAQTPAVLDQLSMLQKKLAEGAGYDPALEKILEQLQSVHAELRAAASDLNRYQDRVEANPERMGELADRLDVLEKLKRKYGASLGEVIARRDQLADELAALESSEQNLETLEAAIADKEKALERVSKALSQTRRTLADDLKQQLLNQLQVLAMPAVSFDVVFIPSAYSREGMEEVEFLFSANPGEALKSLAKVASGGELSRFLLAMKVLTAASDGLLTLVFDEIDSGISGPTAKAVAEKLASLSHHLQVLTITHQPMIAAMGQQHLHVEKRVVQDSTGQESVSVGVQLLERDENSRLKVLSRLVSGVDTNDEAVKKFIRRLRQQAKEFHRQPSTVTLAKSGQG
ncbi:MAG: replication and repair protein RecN [Vampirovibrio sp.]|jgi:DNA repair protein RecN (Recombination protein N)|nr:replication and repair protein RecN [Vampirovibrio sp.]